VTSADETTLEAAKHAEVEHSSTSVDESDLRLIDRWFPCTAVDKAVGTPEGSGRSEKALFTWFASRPVAQARAAALTTLLPDEGQVRSDIESAIHGNKAAHQRLASKIAEYYADRPPVVLDMFSGRGILPLEAARIGATAVGVDLSPVATLGGRLLAEYPFRDWSGEPPLPFSTNETEDSDQAITGLDSGEPRLLSDVRTVLAEVGRRLRDAVQSHYPRNPDGRFPWAYLWAITIPCDQCYNRFPLIGSLVLRHPYKRRNDAGQALRLVKRDNTWWTEVIDGLPDQQPTLFSGGGNKKSAKCLFCGHIHPLDVIKRKGFHRQYEDSLLAVADGGDTPRKRFRAPREDEVRAATSIDLSKLPRFGSLSAVPAEKIPPGNEDTVRASGYGYQTYGELMNPRQAIQFVETVRAIRAVHSELLKAGLSEGYASVLAGYATANLQRRLRRSTRGAKLLCHGKPTGTAQNRVQAHDVFADESKISFQFDYIETGPDKGPGTWSSVSESGLNALRKVIEENLHGKPGRFRRASATALPYRDGSVTAVITDPPYYNMIDYADASDLFHVWFQRALFDIMPDLFAEPGLQDKADEIIIKRGSGPGEHRTRDFYQRMLAKAFHEAKRVLRPDGHLVVVFGHSDPDAWRRLLGALHDAGFVITSAWPSRTETSNTGVASIKVTVTIGCRLAKPNRPTATAAQVDREINKIVQQRVREWDRDGLALADQLMAAYGPAMEVFGRYSRVLRPDGSAPPMDHYLNLALAAVREATAVRVDDLPLETFDAATRFAVFWLRLYGLTVVPKGDARFLAQADGLRLDDLRNRLLLESRAGFKLRIDDIDQITVAASTFEVALALAEAWRSGGTEAAAAVLAMAEREPTDSHLWAVVKEITAHLPSSHAVTKALSAITRNATAIGSLASRRVVAQTQRQEMLFDET
jgi:adenine-specific DNA methylase